MDKKKRKGHKKYHKKTKEVRKKIDFIGLNETWSFKRIQKKEI